MAVQNFQDGFTENEEVVWLVMQGKILEEGGKVELKVYDEDTHRLALSLDRNKKLLPIVKATLLKALGVAPPQAAIRLQNLV